MSKREDKTLVGIPVLYILVALPNAKEEESDKEVEFLFKVKSTYKTLCEGIMRRRQLKIETELKAARRNG